jgi:hypothetical protein
MIDDLLERADAALNRPSSSEELQAVIAELQAAITANDRAWNEALARANDASLTIDEKRQARAERNRLTDARSDLDDRLKKLSGALREARDDEEQQRLLKPYEAILAEHAALVEKARAVYPSAVAAIAGLLEEIAHFNAKVATMQVPRGFSKPDPVECVARDIGPHQLGNGYRSLLSARFPPWQANSPSWPATAPSGISPAVAGILDQVAEIERQKRARWADMEVEH